MHVAHAEPTGARSILLLSLAGFFSSSAFRICDPLLPQLAKEFGTSTGSAAYTITVFSIAYGSLQIFWGPVGDRFGKYRTAAFATFACAVGNVGAFFSESLTTLILCRAIAGATGGGIIPLALAWIGDTTTYAERQQVVARFLTGTILGIACGQFIGGLFTDTLGWRWAFAMLAAGYLLVGALLQQELRRTARGARAGIAAVPATQRSFLSRAMAIVADRWSRIILTTVAIEGAILFGSLAFVPSALHAHFGISLTLAGGVVAGYGFGGVGYTLVARRLVDALGERGLATGGGIVMLFAFAALWLAPHWMISAAACFAIGFGFYMLHNTLQTNATQMAPTARGIAVAMFASAFFIGQSIGVALGAIVVDRLGTDWLYVIAMVLLPVIAFAFARLLATRPPHHFREPEDSAASVD